MRRDFVQWTLLLLAVSVINGCCNFIPCHAGTWIVGTVRSTDGRAMEGALVSLYGQSQQVGKNGCFVFDLADALPLTFTTTASGYASYERAAQSGFFRVVVVLEPSTSGKASTAEWTEIPRREFAGAGKECR